MKKFLALIITFTSVLALGGVIKETKQGEGIQIWTNPSGIMTQIGYIDPTTGLGGSGFVAKQYLINGNFDLWQRGASRVITPSGTGSVYSADRWNSQDYFATGQLTVARSTDVPTGTSATYSFSTTVDTTITFSGSNNHGINGGVQFIEGLISRSLIGKVVTLSFWVKSSTAGTYNVLFANTNPALSSGARYMAGYTISSANTWEKKSVTLTIDSAYGTFAKDNTIGLVVYFPLAVNASGTNVGGSLNTWYSSSSYLITTSSNRTEMMASGSVFKLSQVMLNEGPLAAPFQLASGSPDGELKLAERYAELLNDGVSTNYAQFRIHRAGGQWEAPVRFRTIKRSGTVTLKTGDGTALSSLNCSNTPATGNVYMYNANSGAAITCTAGTLLLRFLYSGVHYALMTMESADISGTNGNVGTLGFMPYNKTVLADAEL